MIACVNANQVVVLHYDLWIHLVHSALNAGWKADRPENPADVAELANDYDGGKGYIPPGGLTFTAQEATTFADALEAVLKETLYFDPRSADDPCWTPLTDTEFTYAAHRDSQDPPLYDIHDPFFQPKEGETVGDVWVKVRAAVLRKVIGFCLNGEFRVFEDDIYEGYW